MSRPPHLSPPFKASAPPDTPGAWVSRHSGVGGCGWAASLAVTPFLGWETGWLSEAASPHATTNGRGARPRCPPRCPPSVTEPQWVLGPRPLWSTVSCCVWGAARLCGAIRPLSPPCAPCPCHTLPKARLEVPADSVPPLGPVWWLSLWAARDGSPLVSSLPVAFRQCVLSARVRVSGRPPSLSGSFLPGKPSVLPWTAVCL